MIEFKNLDKDIVNILDLLAKRNNKKRWCTIKARKKCYVLKCTLCNYKVYRGTANLHQAIYAMGEHGREHTNKYSLYL